MSIVQIAVGQLICFPCLFCLAVCALGIIMLEFITFFACLEFAMSNSSYNIIMKPKQVACLESLYLGKDVVCVLPTGYGKSLVFHLLPSLMFARNRSQETQIEFLKTWKLSGSVLKTLVP